MSSDYIHGYNKKEEERLVTQADTLSGFIYDRFDLSGAGNILEIGSGVGAQMIYIMNHYPDVHVTGVEIAKSQLQKAKQNLEKSGISKDRYRLIEADAAHTGLEDESFDLAVGIWVLEHLNHPVEVLKEVLRLLKVGGKLLLNEVYNRSLHIYPVCPSMDTIWEKYNLYQAEVSGDPDIGIKLGNMISQAGFHNVEIKPYPLLFDKNNWAQRNVMFDYWQGLLESAVVTMQNANYDDGTLWPKIVEEFDHLKVIDDSFFYYSFMQGFAEK